MVRNYFDICTKIVSQLKANSNVNHLNNSRKSQSSTKGKQKIGSSTGKENWVTQSARERLRKEEQERLEREAAEAERKLKEEEEARERTAREAAEKEAALVRLREEKAISLGVEPEKGPDVTQILVRFPSGERKGRRFQRTAKLQSLYDYVDSLGCLEAESYTLFSNFPRVAYGQDKLSLSLEEAGLHPQASLFVEINS